MDSLFHFVSRTKQSIRWDLDNLIASCRGCNLEYEQSADFVHKIVEWYKRNVGDWDALVLKGNTIVKRSRTDLVELLEVFRKQLGTVCLR